MIHLASGAVVETASAEMLPLPAAPGVFETLQWQDGRVFFFADHWSRFARGCEWFGIPMPTTRERMQALAAFVAEKNGVRHGVLRFAAWATTREADWRVEVSPARPHMTRRDFRVGRGGELPAPTADRAFKHLEREPWLAALRRARADGWDEALLFDPHGGLVEGCVSNVFLVAEDRLLTPSVATGPLPGVMRARVIAQARALGIEVREGELGENELQQSSEIWLTNALIGVRAATEFAGRKLPSSPPLLQRLRAAWQAQHGWDPVVVSPPA